MSGPSTEEVSPALALADPREVGTLAAKMGDAYCGMMRFHMEQMEYSFSEAKERLKPVHEGEYLTDLLERPAEQLSWWQLNAIAESSPERMTERWQEVKQAALDELQSGHRAASAAVLPMQDSPMDRARYLAIRHDMALQWKPEGGIESTLIDQMAQSWTMQIFWQELATTRSLMHCKKPDRHDSRYELPRVDHVTAIEQATAMVERWNRMFLRQLKTLQSMRRCVPEVVIQSPSQVNIAAHGGQQVNLSGVPDPASIS